MTNEEKEAIECLERQIRVCNENAEICDNNNFDEEATHLREESYMLHTALSLIKEQQEEIVKLKVNLAKSCADRTLDRETLKNQENENLEALHRAYNEELDKKNKQIDLMAKFIENNMSEKKIINEICIKSKCNNEECHEDDLKDCIKQYFERKVEDVKD